ncbi:MAG: 5-dehydro-2-deoxygluconokinase [Legionella sp.]|nr:5-dehydro-2-deoxygluconokinase [Legionella sp.]
MTYPFFPKDRPIDIICMGRVAVDLYAEQIGSTLAEAETFRKYLGGCAGNIAVGCARLGLKSMMFSCVGDDEMGLFLKNTLMKEGVNTDLLYETKKHLTGLVLLGVKPPHDFPLLFYRNDCADMQLSAEHINESVFKKAKAILITGTGLSTLAMRETTHLAVKTAKKWRTAIVFDLDYRPVLWGLTTVGDGETRYLPYDEISKIYQEILPSCDLIVGTEEEISIAGGKDTLKAAIHVIREYSKAPIVVKTGDKGCTVYFDGEAPLVSKPFPVEVLNILGAGDAFLAGLLRGLLRNEPWSIATRYANASGALVVTRHGCAPAIPYWEELAYFINKFDEDPLVWKSDALAKLHDSHLNLLSPVTLIKNPNGFIDGVNSIVSMNKVSANTGMNFNAVKLCAGHVFNFNPDYEFAAVLMTGRVEFHYLSHAITAERRDYFSEFPIVLHCPARVTAQVQALTDCELLLIETENDENFAPILFDESNSLEIDERGKNLLEDTSYRQVRTVFDKRNRPESNLVVGEIITFQGRWSSYPSHYHSQPEIYHYRFSEPQGFAFGENGREVMRIEHNDTYQIADGQEHAHCAAPGYAMYTLWFIRHLPENPYITPTFRPEHDWTRFPDANKRAWKKSAQTP